MLSCLPLSSSCREFRSQIEPDGQTSSTFAIRVLALGHYRLRIATAQRLLVGRSKDSVAGDDDLSGRTPYLQQVVRYVVCVGVRAKIPPLLSHCRGVPQGEVS